MNAKQLFHSVLEYFWQADALAAAKTAAKPTTTERQALTRARWLLELSDILVDPNLGVALKDVPRDVRASTALSLLSEAAYLGSVAYSGVPAESVQAALRRFHEGDAQLAQAAKKAADALGERTQHELAKIEESQAIDYVVDLRSLVAALVSRVGDLQDSPAVVMARRVRRLFVVMTISVCLLVVGNIWGPGIWYGIRHPLISGGVRWHTSSTADNAPLWGSDMIPYGPHKIFFHTATENSPWIHFDLDHPQRVGAVEVWNRSDCCMDRAAPLVVETSMDDAHWKEVARRHYSFSYWRVSFRTVEARYLRLRVDKKSLLHLERVAIRH